MCIRDRTKPGQTPHYTAMDHVRDTEKYLGRKIDKILVNNKPISREVLTYYKKYGSELVRDDIDQKKYQVVRHDLLSPGVIKQSEADKVFRSILRHDSLKIAHALHDTIGTI